MSSDQSPGEDRHPDGNRHLGADRLAALLAQANGDEWPTPEELAEALWLARYVMGPDDFRPAPPVPARRFGTASDPGRPDTARTPHNQPPPGLPSVPPELPGGRVPLHLPGKKKDSGREGIRLLAPGPPMLTHPLAFQRALRPVKRRVPAPVGHVLNEEATARRIAEFGAWWLPVLCPAAERWLTLRLVYDTGPTMPVWGPLIRELHTALAQSGVFRTVELQRLAADGTIRPAASRSYAVGRTVTLLISDCMGPQWRAGAAGDRWYPALRQWAARMPVAILQPLPERLWRTTALPAATARIAAPGQVTPNAEYAVRSYAVDGLTDNVLGDVLPIPVLEPAAPWLATWASLVSGDTAGELRGSVALLPSGPPSAPVDDAGRGDVERLPAEELVLGFRSLASPEAFRLAAHLALGVPVLPVMRLVQAAVEPRPQPQHLAEVVLSGLLTTVPGPSGSYAFRPGVRELLLGTLPLTARERTVQFLHRVGASIDARAGVAHGEFPVVAPGEGAAATEGEPFAAVREESARRLGSGAPPDSAGLLLGRYRLVRRLGRGLAEGLWQAEDTRSGRTVAVHAYPFARPEDGRRILDDARALACVRHAHVVAVLDYGLADDRAYVVTEFVEALSVAQLTADGDFALPFALLAPLAQQVAMGLKALHEQSLTHGGIAPGALLVCPDDTVKITYFALGRTRSRDTSRDLRRFGHLIGDLAGGPYGYLSHVPSEFRTLFNDAITPLTSSDLMSQRRGIELFLTPSFAQVLEAAAAERYRYRLLGPVRIRQGERTLSAGSPAGQALLCMLLLAHGRPVPYSELVEGLWGPEAPQNADRLLTDHVADLRGTLGPGLLATTAGGYALHTGPGGVDVDRFAELVEKSAELRRDGNPAEARAAVQESLDLWSGHPVDGVPGPAARTTRSRMRALRLALWVSRAELDLELGDFERAARDLDDLLRAHPKHEDLRRLHILALKEQGRIAEAIASYEAYERYQEQQYSEPNPTMLRLYDELRTAPEQGGSAIGIAYDGPGASESAHRAIGRALTRSLSLSEMASGQYEVSARADGYSVIAWPGSSVLTALAPVMHELPDTLAELADPPTVHVTFWHTLRSHEEFRLPHPADRSLVVVLSPALHDELANSTIGVDPALFHPVRRGTPLKGPAVAWYCTLGQRNEPAQPGQGPAPEEGDLLRGPFTTRDLRSLRTPDPRRTAVVHTQPPENSLTLLNPDQPHGKRTSWPIITYYEVDLTVRRFGSDLSLPSSGGGTFAATAELTWHIDDPVAFVRGAVPDVQGRLFEHLAEEAGRITRRYPLRRATSAENALHQGLRTWPVPGLSVTCKVRLAPGEKPSSGALAREATTKRRGRRAP